MKKRLFVSGLAMFAVFCFLFSTTAFGADIELAKKSTIEKILKRGELRVGFESGYMPFEMTNKEGKFIGFDMDFGKRLAKAMGVKFVPVNTAWDGIIASLMTDKFDIIMGGMTITQKRNLQVCFADPYIVVGQAVLMNIKHVETVKSYRDLNDPKYILTSRMGTTGEEAIKERLPKGTYKGFDSEADAAMEVITGKADAMIYDLPFVETMQAMHGEGKTVILEKSFTYEPLAWAINKGDPDFLNFLNNFLRQSKGDGFYDKVYNKWIIGT
ncbi:MAG: transporter substrate-binding domain-containing protein, partial [Desulfobacterales bacterium]|nr:transporter substrate-binding domain-containing protein [Desulfobacterales bacterium]